MVMSLSSFFVLLDRFFEEMKKINDRRCACVKDTGLAISCTEAEIVIKINLLSKNVGTYGRIKKVER